MTREVNMLNKIKNLVTKSKNLVAKAVLVTAATCTSVYAYAATYTVTDVVTEIEKGEAPVAAVASATITLYVVRRVWKIIRGSI